MRTPHPQLADRKRGRFLRFISGRANVAQTSFPLGYSGWH